MIIIFNIIMDINIIINKAFIVFQMVVVTMDNCNIKTGMNYFGVVVDRDLNSDTLFVFFPKRNLQFLLI